MRALRKSPFPVCSNTHSSLSKPDRSRRETMVAPSDRLSASCLAFRLETLYKSVKSVIGI
jgi:hypothetical protein